MVLEKVVVLDDELIIRKTLESLLRKKRCSVASAETLAQAEAFLAKDSFDLIFVDINLPDGQGTELLERLSNKPDGPMVVMMTADGSIEAAVECMKKGAFDYLAKPFSEEHIELLISKAESFKQLVKVNQYLVEEQTFKDSVGIIGESEPMLRLKELIGKVAATEATVLITGENGTGKELIAEELYRLSGLYKQPFIRVNCAAISETLIESEFFGHEKGSFTGATQKREGRFELANNGTILLDEVGEIPLPLQAKLLRVLQEREFERVGGTKTIKVNVRLIASTNRNLLQEVRNGTFREDLYYRLNVFPIESPPLRERSNDVLLLAQEFLKRYTVKHKIKVKGFSNSSVSLFQSHDWPGNVRELQNAIERAIILSYDDEEISPDKLGLPNRSMIKNRPRVNPTTKRMRS